MDIPWKDFCGTFGFSGPELEKLRLFRGVFFLTDRLDSFGSQYYRRQSMEEILRES